MAVGISIKIDGVEKVTQAIADLGARSQQAAVKAINLAANDIRNTIIDNLMNEKNGRVISNDAGAGGLAGSFTERPADKATMTHPTARVGTTLHPHHAPDVEYGTRPHYPPLKPLELWAKKKLHKNDKEAEAFAKNVAWKIYRYGTKAQPYFRPAVEKAGGFLQNRLAQEVKKV